jgi:hypothetical protein
MKLSPPSSWLKNKLSKQFEAGSKKRPACYMLASTLRMEAICSPLYIPEDRTLHSHRCENLRSSTVITSLHTKRIDIVSTCNILMWRTSSSILTYSWSWALLEKLPIVQPLIKFPAFYGTRRFITAFTRALHWSLACARSIHSPPFHPLSLRSILILSSLAV